MKKINFRNLLIIILMIGALIGISKDFINLMSGATYTWFGLVSGSINLIIIGKGLDIIRG